MTTDPGDLVLDPTCGSGSTAYVAEQCRWIRSDTYYRLADSPDGIKKETELTGTLRRPKGPVPRRGRKA
jgi:adenine-specific DNA-methyltransferase